VKRVLGAVALALTAVACGTDEAERLPAACTNGPQAIAAALRSAPAAVRLHGVPLSACLNDEAGAGDLQVVGSSYVAVSARLADQARSKPEGAAALRLGYLVGATRRGAGDQHGVHAELVRRLEQELLAVDTDSVAFDRGLRAGRRSG
jgi:hypothetical protein